MEKNMMTEELLDSAACDALGANTAADSAAYQQALATLGEDEKALDRSLRETVARLSTASPYMEPSADLRGRILQATAPTTFRMEDYRRVNQESSRFLRWGFAAAIAFLIGASWYNMYVSNKLTQANNQIAALAQQAKERNDVISAFVNPKSGQLLWQDGQGNTFARAIFDPTTRKAVVIVPQELVPGNQALALTLKLDKDAQPTTFQTVMVTAPAQQLGLKVPQNVNIAQMFNVNAMHSDDSRKTYIAGQ